MCIRDSLFLLAPYPPPPPPLTTTSGLLSHHNFRPNAHSLSRTSGCSKPRSAQRHAETSLAATNFRAALARTSSLPSLELPELPPYPLSNCQNFRPTLSRTSRTSALPSHHNFRTHAYSLENFRPTLSRTSGCSAQSHGEMRRQAAQKAEVSMVCPHVLHLRSRVTAESDTRKRNGI
eukprot:272411-Rhodomonas_salina.3